MALASSGRPFATTASSVVVDCVTMNIGRCPDSTPLGCLEIGVGKQEMLLSL